jgi:allophanate hydrolase
VSVFTHRIEQAEIVFALIQGFDQEDPFSRPAPRASSFTIESLRLGSPPPRQLEFFGDIEAQSLFERAQERLLKSVASLVDIDYEPFSKAAKLLYEGAWVAERTLAVGEHLEAHPEDADPIVRKIVLGGRDLRATEAFATMVRLAELRRQTEQAWAKMDVLVLPTTPTTYSFDEVDLDPVGTNARLGTYTNFVNLLDLCALALPAGHRRDGTALGITLLAPAFREDQLFALGRRYLQEAGKRYSAVR